MSYAVQQSIFRFTAYGPIIFTRAGPGWGVGWSGTNSDPNMRPRLDSIEWI